MRDNVAMYPRIFHSAPLSEGAEIRLTGNSAAHLGKVLRLRERDAVILFNGEGLDHMARIISIDRHDVAIVVGKSHDPCTESPLAVTLLQGICRGQRMDILIQKSTELGVREIQPIHCERSVAKIAGSRVQKKIDHWRSVAISACEQCGRSRIPVIGLPDNLANALDHLDAKTARLILDPAGSEDLQTAIGSHESVALLVGPEGGLTAKESELAIEAGFKRVRLGPRILRTETAPIAAMSIIQYLSGDLTR